MLPIQNSLKIVFLNYVRPTYLYVISSLTNCCFIFVSEIVFHLQVPIKNNEFCVKVHMSYSTY